MRLEAKEEMPSEGDSVWPRRHRFDKGKRTRSRRKE